MAIGKKSGGRDFKPGNPGGPGRPPLPPDLRRARELNRQEFERVANKFLFLGRDELVAVVKDPGTPTLELMVASVLVKAIESGDQHRTDWIISRLIGKVPERHEHTGANGQPLSFVQLAQAAIDDGNASKDQDEPADPES